MGLFDNQEPDTQNALNQGLLSAGLGILANNRGLNAGWASVGQGGQEGLNAFQAALSAPLQRKLLGAKAQQAAAEAQQSEMATAMLKQRIAILSGQQPGMAPGSPTPAPAPTDQGLGPTNQAASQSMPGNGMPAVAGASSATPGTASPLDGQFDIITPRREQGMKWSRLADTFLAAGDGATAAQYQELANKTMPAFKDSQTLTINGRRVKVDAFDDGSHRILPMGPDQEKPLMVDTGNQHLALDPFSLQQRGQWNQSIAPADALKAAVAQREQNISFGLKAPEVGMTTNQQPVLPPSVGVGGSAAPPMITPGPQGGPPMGAPIRPPVMAPPGPVTPPGSPMPAPGAVPGVPAALTQADKNKLAMVGQTKMRELDAAQVDKWRQAATEVRASVFPNLDELSRVSKLGVYSGTPGTVEAKMNTINFLGNALGIPVDTAKLARSQDYEKEKSDLVRAGVKAAGGGQIRTAMITLAGKTVPGLDTDPAARLQLINLLRQAGQRQIDLYQAGADHFNAHGGSLTGFDPSSISAAKVYNPASGTFQ